MGDEIRGLLALGELAVRGALVVVLGGGVSWALRRAPAAYRCLVWQATVALLLCLPLALFTLPELRLAILPRTSPARAVTSLPWLRTAEGALTAAPTTGRSDKTDPALRQRPSTAATRSRPGSGADASRSQPRPFSWLLGLWGAGTTLGLASLLTALLRARILLRRAHAVQCERLSRLLAEAQHALSWSGAVRLVMGSCPDTLEGPMTSGLFRPTVILPSHAVDWSDERARIVLLHELAHVQRRDWPWHLAAQAACALYWWNPLVWLAAERMRRETERACDDQVLLAGIPASEYAAQLVELATWAKPSAPASALVGMARGSRLAGRIEAILHERTARARLSRSGAAAAASTATCALLTMGCVALAPRPGTSSPAAVTAEPPVIAASSPPAVPKPVRTQPVHTAAPASLLHPSEALLTLPADPGQLAEVRPLPPVIAPDPALEAPAVTPAAPLTGQIVVGGHVQTEGWRIFSLDPATGKLQVAISRGGERARLAPDRRTLAYERETDGEAPALLVGDLGGAKASTAQPFVDPWVSPDSRYPVWAPDGQSFLCSFSERYTEPGLKTYRFAADGSRKELVPIPATDWVSDWSPDGQWLLTVSGRNKSGPHIFLMRTDGSGARALTEGAGWSNWAPRFSPDGKRVLYAASERPGNPGVPVHDALWTVSVDGKDRRKVFSEPNVGALGTWSPDGRHILVIRWDWDRDERGKGIAGKTYRAEVIDVEGNGRRVLASFPWMARVGMPDWR